MTTKQQTSLSVAFSDDITECKGVLFELPTAEVMAGDTIELRLWGGTYDLLLPYTLFKGTQTLGAGTLVEETGVPQIAPVIDFAETFQHQLEYPVDSIVHVEAITEIVTVDYDGIVVTWATKGEDITSRFARLGYSCIFALDRIPLYGSVRALCNRSPWKKYWPWTIPDGQEGLHWFFIYKENMVLDHKFSIELPDLAGTELAYRNITLKVVDKDTDAAVPDAAVTFDGLLIGTTDIDGKVYADEVKTGTHALLVTATGYLDTDADDLNNETVEIY